MKCLLWGCFVASVQGTTTSQSCSGTGLERNVLSGVRNLGLSYRSGPLQQDNGPKHTENDTRGWLRAEPFTPLKCPSLSAALNPSHHLWKQLKLAACRKGLRTRDSCSNLGYNASAGAEVSLGGTEIAPLHQLPPKVVQQIFRLKGTISFVQHSLISN